MAPESSSLAVSHASHEDDPSLSVPFPVVGLGAAAGGLSALTTFFAHMPAESGMAFVISASPLAEPTGELASALARATPIAVHQVAKPVRLAPNAIYLIPPGMQLEIAAGTLHVSDLEPTADPHLSMDQCLRTLAIAQRSHTAAVILAGTGSDGTSGLQRVKELGGVTLVQDPHEAEVDELPRMAIRTGMVDFVLPLAELATTLVTYWQRSAERRAGPHDATAGAAEDAALNDIFALLRARTGHDFSHYKRPTVSRRLGRRLHVTGAGDLATYLTLLQQQPEEVQALLQDLLISVTNFFRDRAAWSTLESVIPQLFAVKAPEAQVRVWVAACATGEEAYSVAMLLAEWADTLPQRPRIHVFATDINEAAIAVARQGYYATSIAGDISPARLQRFFLPDQAGYRVKPELRELVVFARHNVLHDPPFSHVDLITCRNLLIYLNREAQALVLQAFHFSLRDPGYLLLGGSESLDGLGHLFSTVDKAQRIYQRRFDVGPRSARPNLVLPRPGPLVAPSMPLPPPPAHSFSALHQSLVAPYTPPSVIINEEGEIVYLGHSMGPLLHFEAGALTSNLLKVVHPDLRLDLRGAIFTARQQGERIEAHDVRLVTPGGMRLVDLIVQPIAEPAWARGHLLVLFQLGTEPSARGLVPPPATADAIVAQLERQLEQTRFQLRATIEEYEAVVEEDKAVNEELQAINEELRAAGEELETSKEELQSTNEELSSVNQELKHKVMEVSEAHNDLQNLIASTQIGTIFLDRALCIKRFTPSVQAIFNLIPADLGRPLAHVTHSVLDADLRQDALNTLQTLATMTREVQTSDGRWYIMQVLPYRTLEERIDGVVLTFVEITARKAVEQALAEARQSLDVALEAAEMGVWDLDLTTEAARTSLRHNQIFGYEEPVSAWGADILRQHLVPEDEAKFERGFAAALETGVLDLQVRVRWGDGSVHWVYERGRVAYDAHGVPLSIAGVTLDITGRKLIDEALRRARDELEQSVYERTADLAMTNARLQAEIAERRQVEQSRQDLLQQLVNAQEEERQRISRELHDHFGQQLTVLTLGLKALEPFLPAAGAARETLHQLREITTAIGREAHQLARDLRPSVLDDLGLTAALQSYAAQWGERAQVTVEVHPRGMDGPRLPASIEMTIYRVVQEALTNVLKHAQASHVSLLLERRAESLHVIIEDNGRGFDPEAVQHAPSASQRLGLRGMRERVALVQGSLNVESVPGRGTTVFVHVPVPDTGGDAPHDSD